MKKLLIIALLLLAFVLVSCGSGDDSSAAIPLTSDADVSVDESFDDISEDISAEVSDTSMIEESDVSDVVSEPEESDVSDVVSEPDEKDEQIVFSYGVIDGDPWQTYYSHFYRGSNYVLDFSFTQTEEFADWMAEWEGLSDKEKSSMPLLYHLVKSLELDKDDFIAENELRKNEEGKLFYEDRLIELIFGDYELNTLNIALNNGTAYIIGGEIYEFDEILEWDYEKIKDHVINYRLLNYLDKAKTGFTKVENTVALEKLDAIHDKLYEDGFIANEGDYINWGYIRYSDIHLDEDSYGNYDFYFYSPNPDYESIYWRWLQCDEETARRFSEEIKESQPELSVWDLEYFEYYNDVFQKPAIITFLELAEKHGMDKELFCLLNEELKANYHGGSIRSYLTDREIELIYAYINGTYDKEALKVSMRTGQGIYYKGKMYTLLDIMYFFNDDEEVWVDLAENYDFMGFIYDNLIYPKETGVYHASWIIKQMYKLGYLYSPYLPEHYDFDTATIDRYFKTMEIIDYIPDFGGDYYPHWFWDEDYWSGSEDLE